MPSYGYGEGHRGDGIELKASDRGDSYGTLNKESVSSKVKALAALLANIEFISAGIKGTVVGSTPLVSDMTASLAVQDGTEPGLLEKLDILIDHATTVEGNLRVIQDKL